MTPAPLLPARNPNAWIAVSAAMRRVKVWVGGGRAGNAEVLTPDEVVAVVGRACYIAG